MDIFDGAIPERNTETYTPTVSDFRKFNKIYTTRKLYDVPCGHKISLESVPTRKCDTCWSIWFNEDSDRVLSLHEEFSKDKNQFLNKYGKVFTRQFVRFMAAVAKLRKNEE